MPADTSGHGADLPTTIVSDDALEEVMSRPAPGVAAAMKALDGDLVILGAGGKMGPSLARQARRAMDAVAATHQVIAVSRFSDPSSRAMLEAQGVKTVVADLLDPASVEALPDAAAVIFMAGMKFGATGAASLTWAMNTLAPAWVGRRYAGVPTVVFSSGNVYPFMPVSGPGATEATPPAPVGEYAQSVLGRERIFEHYANTLDTPVLIFRLFYAAELRYGVLHDVANCVWSGRPVDVTMGQANCIWQGDANGMALRSVALAESPARCLNVSGPQRCIFRDLAKEFGRRFNRPVDFEGKETATALICDASEAVRRFGAPAVSLDRLTGWVADWVQRGGTTLGKPTHFEVRDGKF